MQLVDPKLITSPLVLNIAASRTNACVCSKLDKYIQSIWLVGSVLTPCVKNKSTPPSLVCTQTTISI